MDIHIHTFIIRIGILKWTCMLEGTKHVNIPLEFTTSLLVINITQEDAYKLVRLHIMSCLKQACMVNTSSLGSHQRRSLLYIVVILSLQKTPPPPPLSFVFNHLIVDTQNNTCCLLVGVHIGRGVKDVYCHLVHTHMTNPCTICYHSLAYNYV